MQNTFLSKDELHMDGLHIMLNSSAERILPRHT